MFTWVKELYCRFLNFFKGGSVCKCRCSCDKQGITIKFEPLEINLNVNIRVVPPEDEQKIKGELTLGPVSEKNI